MAAIIQAKAGRTTRTCTIPWTFLFLAMLALLATRAWPVTTSHWTQTNPNDFKKGVFHDVVASNLGELKLARSTKTLLEEDPRVTAVLCLVQGPDGTVYAGTGPHGIVLQIKDDKVTSLATFEDNSLISALLIDKNNHLLVGVSGETGKVYRIDNPSALAAATTGPTDSDRKAASKGKGPAPVQIFSAEDVQYIWSLQQTPDGFLYVATGPHGQLFQVDPDGQHSVMFDSDESNLLCLLSDGKDMLYIGTEPNGLVYRVNRKTKDVYVMFDAPETEIHCLALDAKGNLYAATAEASEHAARAEGAQPVEKSGRPEGIKETPLPSTPPSIPAPPVLPVPPPGEPHPIPKSTTQAGAASTHCESLMAGNFGAVLATSSVYLAPCVWDFSDEPPTLPPSHKIGKAESAAAAGPAAPTGPVEAENPEESRHNGNAVYRINPKGFVTEIFRENVMVLSLLEKDGSLLVGTGNDGLIYHVTPDKDESLVITRVDPRQVTAMLPLADGRVMLGLANVGGLAAMSGGYSASGTFTSPVLDATQISTFGKIHLTGSLPENTTLSIATRSGNVADATKAGWAPWSEEIPAAEFVQVPSNPARFLQYRLTLATKDAKASPLVNSIDVAYQLPNIAPVVKSVRVGPTSSGEGPEPKPAPAAGSAHGGTRVQTITWDADDADGDALLYTIYFRAGAHGQWIQLKDKLTDTHFDWDTRTVADGRYDIKVVASNAAANPPGEGLTGSRVSDWFIVDNTPPAIGDIKTTVKGNSATIEARLVDRTGIVAAAAYSLDSNDDWQIVLPLDKIFDSPEEKVSFTIGGLSPGAHQVTLRATDAKGNQAFETFEVTITAPATRP